MNLIPCKHWDQSTISCSLQIPAFHWGRTSVLSRNCFVYNIKTNKISVSSILSRYYDLTILCFLKLWCSSIVPQNITSYSDHSTGEGEIRSNQGLIILLLEDSLRTQFSVFGLKIYLARPLGIKRCGFKYIGKLWQLLRAVRTTTFYF